MRLPTLPEGAEFREAPCTKAASPAGFWTPSQGFLDSLSLSLSPSGSLSGSLSLSLSLPLSLTLTLPLSLSILWQVTAEVSVQCNLYAEEENVMSIISYSAYDSESDSDGTVVIG